jgi:hypothetical protein
VGYRKVKSDTHVIEMVRRAQRSFIGAVRTGRSSRHIHVFAEDEASATRALQGRYGTENIIEVRCDDGAMDRKSQAETDVGKAVIYNLTGACFAFAKWVLRGRLRR